MKNSVREILVALFIVVLPFTFIEKPNAVYELLLQQLIHRGNKSCYRESSQTFAKKPTYVSVEMQVISYWLCNW
jgi:hypothetical protein